MIGASMALAQMLAGLLVGPIVDHWGFTALFSLAAAAYLLQFPVVLVVQDKTVRPVQPKRQPSTASAVPTNTLLVMFLVGSILVNTANYVAALGRPLVMAGLDFDMTAISSTMGISGLLNLPLPFLMGWLSDRTGRKSVLLVCYLAVALGVGVLGASTTIWHFWLSQIMITLSGSALVVGSAFMTDLVPPEQISQSLSRFSVTPWIGGILGYAFTGIAVQRLGMSLTFAIGAGLPLISMMLLLAMRNIRRPFLSVSTSDQTDKARRRITQTQESVSVPGH
jgi:MFS family permease